MNWLFSLVLVIHILVALGIIGLVLIQHGKGADMGAAFGGGASGSLFGASGSANFFSTSTAVLATAFFLTCLALGYLSSSAPRTSGSVVEGVVQSAPVTESADPAATDAAPAKEETPTTDPGGLKGNAIPR
jgi:preprotein translocase subunit SecG